MADDEDEDELGQVGEQLNGIAGRFGQSETRDVSETGDMSETSETAGAQSGEMSETTETAGASETGGMSETTETPDPGDEEFDLREHWNGRTIYLPDDDVDDLDLRYKECSIKWQRQRGGDLPKNERFYPAVVRAALNETTIEDELGLSE